MSGRTLGEFGRFYCLNTASFTSLTSQAYRRIWQTSQWPHTTPLL